MLAWAKPELTMGTKPKHHDLRPRLTEKLKQLDAGAPWVYFDWPGVGRLKLTPLGPYTHGGVIVVHRSRFALGNLTDKLTFEGVYLNWHRFKPRQCLGFTELRAMARHAEAQDDVYVHLDRPGLT